MLPSQYRLPLRTEFTRIQKEGQLFQGKLFSLLVARTQKIKFSQFGFIISTKVDKKAVKRNRGRRLLIEAIREILPKIKPGFSVIFLAKKALIDQELKAVKKEVYFLFKKAKII